MPFGTRPPYGVSQNRLREAPLKGSTKMGTHECVHLTLTTGVVSVLLLWPAVASFRFCTHAVKSANTMAPPTGDSLLSPPNHWFATPRMSHHRYCLALYVLPPSPRLYTGPGVRDDQGLGGWVELWGSCLAYVISSSSGKF